MLAYRAAGQAACCFVYILLGLNDLGYLLCVCLAHLAAKALSALKGSTYLPPQLDAQAIKEFSVSQPLPSL